MGKTVAIIGGGIIGLATAYKLILKRSVSKVHLYEKEGNLGVHQSGRNSGVLHCGLYYQTGSLKARLAVQGIREMTSFCRIHDIPHEICGKIVVASSDDQVARLRALAKRGKDNGLQGLRFLDRHETTQREPHVCAKEVLLVPEEGIVSFKDVMEKLCVLIQQRGGEIRLGERINKVESRNDGYIIKDSRGNEQTYDLLVNCGGLHSDRLFASLSGERRTSRIIPFRGEYYTFKEGYKDLVNHLIYPVPDPLYPFLGVHFTRIAMGDREVGPNAVLAFKREGYTRMDIKWSDAWDIMSYMGMHRFIRKNFLFTIREWISSLSKGQFIRKAQILVPEIREYMLEKGPCGVRAQGMDNQGRLISDFEVYRVSNQVHVVNAPSPGATASLAIAGHIVENYLKELN